MLAKNKFFVIIAISILIVPLFAFSQKMWKKQSTLISQLRKTNADTTRINVLLKLSNYYLYREYYLYKAGKGRIVPDSAYNLAKEILGQDGVAELIFLIGAYTLLATVLNGFDVLS